MSIIAVSNLFCSRSCANCFWSSITSEGKTSLGSLFISSNVMLSFGDFLMKINPWYSNTQWLIVERLMPCFLARLLKVLPPIKYSLIISSFCIHDLHFWSVNLFQDETTYTTTFFFVVRAEAFQLGIVLMNNNLLVLEISDLQLFISIGLTAPAVR